MPSLDNNINSVPSSRRSLQRRVLYEFQFSSRIALLESRLDSFALNVAGLSQEAWRDGNPEEWPAPPPIPQQEIATIFRLAGELQRIRAVIALHRLEATMLQIRGLQVDDREKALTDIVAKEQRALLEIPVASLGTVGLLGERYYATSDAAANWKKIRTVAQYLPVPSNQLPCPLNDDPVQSPETTNTIKTEP